VPYEKGFNFLYYLESLVGEDVFGAWLKQYLQDFSYEVCAICHFRTPGRQIVHATGTPPWPPGAQTVTVEQWKEHLDQYMEAAGKAEALMGVDWDTWLNAPGVKARAKRCNVGLVDTWRSMRPV
jgi:hypothetical protein